ncbi:MAPEG family protein [Luteimonas aestuarii]|uniref:MAPEG family protein n=2 Tax=Luteimonas aestuarii TaxID=453837 RepID=A0A4R5TRA5_9GAMM|nr:MAPEG family protein [Luteimonas aestuarii]
MVDMAREEHLIRTRTSLALVVVLVCFAAGHLLLPRAFVFPGDVANRLAFAAQAAAFVLSCLLVAIGMVSTGRRRSRDDIAGAAAGPPSPVLATKVAFLQNTLEQSVLACGAFLAFAAVVDGAWLALLPVAAVLFCVGRVLFYRGYPSGAGGRAFGMALTLLPGALLLLAVLVVVVLRMAASVLA